MLVPRSLECNLLSATLAFRLGRMTILASFGLWVAFITFDVFFHFTLRWEGTFNYHVSLKKQIPYQFF